jgi:hypothetical protein
MDSGAALDCQREIDITRSFIEDMHKLWGIATKWHDDLESRRKVCFDVRSTVDMLTEAGIPRGRSSESRHPY